MQINSIRKKKIKTLIIIWSIAMVIVAITLVRQYQSANGDEVSQITPEGNSSPELFDSPKTGLNILGSGLSSSTNPLSAKPQAKLTSKIVLPKNTPIRIKIPAIKVDTAIQTVGIKNNGEIATPTNAYEVGWFKLGVKPGEEGYAIIAGHLDTKYTPFGVFINLDTLEVGDEIEIKNSSGQTLRFAVSESKTVDYQTPTDKIMPSTDKSHLVLITCAGEWLEDEHTYDQRLLVYADLIP